MYIKFYQQYRTILRDFYYDVFRICFKRFDAGWCVQIVVFGVGLTIGKTKTKDR